MIEPRSQCFAAVTSALTPMKIAAYLIEKIGSTVSGYFHPSLWLSESHGLLVPQGRHRIDFHRSPRGQIAREQCNEDEQDGDGDKRYWIAGRYAKQQAGHQSSQCKSAAQADDHPDQGHLRALPQNHLQHVSGVRS